MSNQKFIAMIKLIKRRIKAPKGYYPESALFLHPIKKEK